MLQSLGSGESFVVIVDKKFVDEVEPVICKNFFDAAAVWAIDEFIFGELFEEVFFEVTRFLIKGLRLVFTCHCTSRHIFLGW